MSLEIEIQLYGNGASDVDILDLILIPSDEWAGHFLGTDTGGTSAVGGRGLGDGFATYLDVDAIGNPRVPVRALRRLESDDCINSIWESRINGPAILRRGRSQRLWFFFPEVYRSSLRFEANPEVGNSVQLWRQARYLSMRGDK
jgi:hypothetical protein